LVDAAARNDWALLDFLLNKKPSQFDLRFSRMCVREGFIKVMDWWKSVELFELIKEAAYRGQWRMLDNLYNNEYQQACSDLKEFLNGSIVNCAVSAGQIDALKWAWDQGIHGGAESCMIAAQIELIKEAAYRGQWRMLDNLYNNEYQQACSDLKEFLNGSIVNCAASAGQIAD
jgi:hypothetical protein